MHPIIAGIISGAVMGLGFDILTIMALQRLRGDDAPPWLQAVLRQTSFFKLVAPMAFFTHAAWTFAGLVAGAIYAAFDDGPASGLGSPFLWFTLVVLALALVYLLDDVGGGRPHPWVDAPLARPLRRHLRLAPPKPRGVGARQPRRWTSAWTVSTLHAPK